MTFKDIFFKIFEKHPQGYVCLLFLKPFFILKNKKVKKNTRNISLFFPEKHKRTLNLNNNIIFQITQIDALYVLKNCSQQNFQR